MPLFCFYNLIFLSVIDQLSLTVTSSPSLPPHHSLRWFNTSLPSPCFLSAGVDHHSEERKQCVTAPNPQTSKSSNEKPACSSLMLVSRECLVCVRGHADMVQHFATCATPVEVNGGGERNVVRCD